jgi:hypothetical protein
LGQSQIRAEPGLKMKSHFKFWNCARRESFAQIVRFPWG